MKKFIPLEKRSKKEQKTYHDAQRGSWIGVVPVTKVIPNKKAYNRKQKHRRDYPLGGAFFSVECEEWRVKCRLMNTKTYIAEKRTTSTCLEAV